MASVKAILWNEQNKDGLYPITIRVIKDRKPSYVYIGHYIEKKYWDADNQKVKKSHPLSRKLNTLIQKTVYDAHEKLLELELNDSGSTSHSVTKKVRSRNKNSFFAQAQVYIDNKRANKKYNQVVSDEPRIKHFKEFLKGVDISFKDITVPLLKKYRAYLKGSRNVSERTIINHLIVIRTIFNQAIEAGIVEQKHYPFGKNKIQIKFPDSLKVGLTREEVQRLENVELIDKKLHHARNLWLFAFYFAGMRISDVLLLKWSDFHSDRLHYSMGKNTKAGSLKLSDKVIKILAEYKREQPKHDLVFPDLEVVTNINDQYDVQRKTSYATKRLNKALKAVAESANINTDLTMHIARHTFGNLSGDKIPIQMLQKLYRHSSLTTTIGYQSNFIHKDADDALDAVIGT
ncbi:MAG: site-specific integrase [Flavipsychrobacter sp.]